MTFLPAFLAAFLAAAPATSSRWLDTERDCRFEELPPDADEGSDAPRICPGPDGWSVAEWYSAVDTYRGLVRGDSVSETLMPAAPCPHPDYGRVMEWRLKGARPVALVYRVSCREETPEGTVGAKVAEYLVVRPLDLARSPLSLDVRKVRSANDSARAWVDRLPAP